MEKTLGGRNLVLFGVFLSVVCLAYFYMLDRFIASSQHFSPIFQLLLTDYDNESAWLVSGVTLLAAAWIKPEPIYRLTYLIGNHAALTSAAFMLPLAAAVLFVYRNYALSMDEYAAVLQSRIFATGQIVAHLQPRLIEWLVVPGFNGAFLVASSHSGQVLEAYWPGFAMLLAPFQAVGAPWLCSPCLASIALYLIHRLTFEITADKRAAGFAVLFTIASGAFVANAISYYSMQAHLTANLLFAFLLLRPTPMRAMLAGVVGSIALVLHNPFPHTLFAIPWIIALARNKAQRTSLLALILGYLPIALFVGVGWYLLRANILLDSHILSSSDRFVSGVFCWPDSVMLNTRVAALAKMWVWASPCLFYFAFLGWRRYRNQEFVRTLVQSAVLTFGAYIFVDLDQGHGWGYRYFHSAWGVAPVLAGCAMTGSSASQRRLAAFAGATAILGLGLLVPHQLNQIHGFIARHLSLVPPPKRPGNDVYFVRDDGGFYVADMIQFDPLLRDQDLFLLSHGRALDDEFIMKNWPGATRAGSSIAADMWYLGPIDQRQITPGSSEAPHLLIVATPVTRSR